jgi:hypothetical protein
LPELWIVVLLHPCVVCETPLLLGLGELLLEDRRLLTETRHFVLSALEELA